MANVVFCIPAPRCDLHQLRNKRLCQVVWYVQVSLHQWVCVQYRLCLVQRRNIGTFEKFSNRDFFTPKQRSFHCCHPVCRVVRTIFLKLFHPWTEPLVGVVVVISDAGTKDIKEREAFVLDALLDELREMLLFAAETSRNECSTGSQSERDGIDWRFDASKRHAFRLHAETAGR